MNVPRTTGEMRALLAQAAARVLDGSLGADQGRSLIGLANQVTASMAVEIKKAKWDAQVGAAAAEFGTLGLAPVAYSLDFNGLAPEPPKENRKKGA